MKFIRRVIRIRAEDSPNVRLALAQKRKGEPTTGDILVPGVLTWEEYLTRRATWTEMEQCIGLDAMFYKGKDANLFANLSRCMDRGRVELCRKTPARAIGIDPAEGGDKTSMAAVNEYGLKKLISEKTSNTATIPGMALAFMREMGVPADKVWFDKGGGGKQHADALNEMGFGVKSIGFGEKPEVALRRGMVMVEERVEKKEERYVYVNLRAQMAHELSLRCDDVTGFAVAGDTPEEQELLRQLGLYPRIIGDWSMYDKEGRIRMLPKNRTTQNSKEPTLREIMGCSPDESDAVMIAEYARTSKRMQPTAGGFN